MELTTKISKATQDENAPCEAVGKGPVIWYDFEADNMKCGTVKNMAGDGCEALITGKAVTVTSPTGADAIHFGTLAEENYVTVKNGEKLNFSIDDEFTIDFWYMLDENATGIYGRRP